MSGPQGGAKDALIGASHEWRLWKWESFDFLTEALDEMGTRISWLEENVTELMTQAGMDEQPVSEVADVLPQ